MKIDSVLIVDDSQVQRLHVADLFDAGTKIRYAVDGEEGLRQLQESLPDLVMLDLEMPRMDGVAMLQAMSELNLMVPVVVMSSKDYMLIASVAFMGRELSLPVLGGLKKPLRRDALDDLLRMYQMASKNDELSGEASNSDEILQAMAKEQFLPFFQPKVTLDGRLLKGVEVLVRWHHPEQGIISPIYFIPAMEQLGVITDLTFIMLKVSLSQWTQWARHGLRVPLSINLSALSLHGKTLVPAIEALVRDAGVPPKYVMFEITETAVAANLAEAIGIAAQLRLCGFGLSIDDFGTGFASVQQLAHFPFTELKIDRSLVTGVSSKPHLKAIFESVINLAERLKLSTVAEGIETEDDMHFVHQHGCMLGQGYLFAKPLNAEQFSTWVKGRMQTAKK